MDRETAKGYTIIGMIVLVAWSLFYFLRSFWFYKILGRKRDISKDHDCKNFEESYVNISNFDKQLTGFDASAYENALFEKKILTGKPANLGRPRNCYGDGHFKCYECMCLDYENSDLIRHKEEPA